MSLRCGLLDSSLPLGATNPRAWTATQETRPLHRPPSQLQSLTRSRVLGRRAGGEAESAQIIAAANCEGETMVCPACARRLARWAAGKGSRRHRGFDPDRSYRCRVCGASLLHKAKYCSGCAARYGVCSMCGLRC